MPSERSNVAAFATWVGGQLKGVRTYVDQQTAAAGSATDAKITQAKSELTALVTTAVGTAKAEILGGASSAYDTLLELQQAIQADQSAVQAITAALGKRVRVDAAQGLSTVEQAQARANISAVATDDLGGSEVDYVALAVAARDS